jgi:hypothetical protein
VNDRIFDPIFRRFAHLQVKGATMRRFSPYVLRSVGFGTLATIFASGIGPVAAQSPKPGEWAMLSPFTAVKPQPDSAIVRFDNHEFVLISVNDQTTGELLSFCRSKYQDWWEKRFTEDLVEVLAEIGHPMRQDKTVKLVLEDPADGRRVTIERAPMTARNRRAAYLFRQESLKDHPDWPK